ncbi:MAG: M20/M25/M40 family metallo-hydrolase [Acidobacteria bacterium]|nr:M20/M25/M40 family metallo-hydrolase [Acidobacteriota bacterium]
MRYLLPFLLLALSAQAQQSIDWPKIEAETLQHFQALVRLDTTDPGGLEKSAVDYLRKVLEAEGIATKTFAVTPERPNLVARIKGNGKKKPLLIMGHTDTVNIDPKKWSHPPFGAVLDGGYVYGRGTVDDKDNVVACLMTMLLIKRLNIPLDRDVIFLAEAGEEGNVRFGILYMVQKYYEEIDAEFCLAEGGGVTRKGGKLQYMSVQTTEKIPYALKLVARGPAGHGSRPLRNNAVVHLSQAVAKAAAWQTPMRMNDTTRAYFERLATISTPEEAARYNNIVNPAKTNAIQEYFAENEPGHYSMLRTSITPTILRAGYRVNVIPSEAEATLDIRGLPDENMRNFTEELKKIINDPQVEVVRELRDVRPGAPPSSLTSPAFAAIEASQKKFYPGIPTLPTMSTGATDMAYLRGKGMQCYGVGPMTDVEDGPKGFGAHSDQERILVDSLQTFVKFHYDATLRIAGAN